MLQRLQRPGHEYCLAKIKDAPSSPTGRAINHIKVFVLNRTLVWPKLPFLFQSYSHPYNIVLDGRKKARCWVWANLHPSLHQPTAQARLLDNLLA